MPKFELEEIEDYYCFFVHMMKISEDMFWYADIYFLDRCVENMAAYDSWHSYVMAKERERIGKLKRS